MQKERFVRQSLGVGVVCNSLDQRNLVGEQTTVWGGFLRVVLLLLPAMVGLASEPAFAKGRTLNPTQLGTFCPQGSELADAEHTQILSVKEQVQIKKTVQGFMVLDADARRGGNPLGTADYWKRGYTSPFEDKAVPVDGLQYIAARLVSLCTLGDSVVAVYLIDVAVFGPGEIPEVWKGSLLSAQKYWDAFSRVTVKLPSATETTVPVQPIVFTTLPLFKGRKGSWLVEQSKVPNLLKFQRSRWLANIAAGTNSSQCKDPAKAISKQCTDIEKEKVMLKQLSRPAWSVLPKDFQFSSSPR